jgi:hypothetical protein
VDGPPPRLNQHTSSHSCTLYVINDALLNMMGCMPWCMMYYEIHVIHDRALIKLRKLSTTFLHDTVTISYHKAF